jgi:branched-chain amino acid transport system permease protein
MSSFDTLLQQVFNGLVLGSLYALIALGYTMVYGIVNLINFAHGDVLMIGALTALSAITLAHGLLPALPGWGLLVVGMLAAMPACVLLACRSCSRPWR